MSCGSERLQIVDNTLTNSSGNQIILKKDDCDEESEQVLYIQGTPDEGNGLVQVVAEENGNQQLLTLDLNNFTLMNDIGEQPYKLYMLPSSSDLGSDGGAILEETCVTSYDLECVNASTDEDQMANMQANKPNPEPDITLEFLAKARESLKSSDKVETRKRRGYQLPKLHELLASPNFKLYVFNCKHCDYKCNAQKDLSNHVKNDCQGRKKPKRAKPSSPVAGPQYHCPQCSFKCNNKRELTQHEEDTHDIFIPIEKAFTQRSHKSSPKKTSSNFKSQSAAAPESESVSNAVVVYMCSCCGLEGDSEAEIVYHDCKEIAKLKR